MNDTLIAAAKIIIAAGANGTLSITISEQGVTDESAFTIGTSKVTPIAGHVDETGTDSAAEGAVGGARISARRALYVTLDTRISGEDQTNDVMKVEGQFTGTLAAVDTQIKASAGYLRLINYMMTDTTPTAGSIITYDNTAESGTVIHNFQVAATAFTPFTVFLDRICTTGIYSGFTTTADVSAGYSFR